MRRVYLSLPEGLLERLESQADQRLVSRNLLVARACERLLDELEDVSDWIDQEARK
jgi:metal-responsive CopG/Arc/MetJ family transcriptional regulator